MLETGHLTDESITENKVCNIFVILVKECHCSLQLIDD